jgi:hypothetical protein
MFVQRFWLFGDCFCVEMFTFVQFVPWWANSDRVRFINGAVDGICYDKK